jgi:hypothetical protein
LTTAVREKLVSNAAYRKEVQADYNARVRDYKKKLAADRKKLREEAKERARLR